MFELLCGERAHDCTTVPRVPAETQLSRVCILLPVLRLADIVPH